MGLRPPSVYSGSSQGVCVASPWLPRRKAPSECWERPQWGRGSYRSSMYAL